MTHIHDSDQIIGAHLGGCCCIQHQGAGPSFAIPPTVEIHGEYIALPSDTRTI